MTMIDNLNINPALVCSIIVKLRAFHAKEQVTFDDSPTQSSYESDGAQILADHADDPTLEELENVIGNISPSNQRDLIALMHIGQGDYSELNEARKELPDNFNEDVLHHLLSNPGVASYLENALAQLGYTCEK